MSSKKMQLVPNYKPFVTQKSIDLVTKTLKSGWVGGDGPRVKEFEKKVGELIGNSNILAVNSATSGLQLVLKMIGVRGYEVLTTPMTCFATNAAIVNEGAIPVWVDVDPQSGNMNPRDIEHKITKYTKAIMVVDWGGTPAELFEITKIARKHKLPVIQDSAQSLGSIYNGKYVGNHCDFVVFSTQAIKIINTGDGGLVAFKSKRHYLRAKKLRWYGIDRDKRRFGPLFWDYPISEVGFKMQMNDVSASIGLGQLPYLQEILKKRYKYATLYNKALLKSTTVRPQKVPNNSKPNFWIYTVICKDIKTRVWLYKALLKIGVKAEQAHRRNDTYPVFKKFDSGNLPGVNIFDKNHLIIPIGYWVKLSVAKKIARVLSNT